MLSQSIRLVSKCVQRKPFNANLQAKRNSSLENWVYREVPPGPHKWRYIVADGLNAAAWWWIFTHSWYQWGHIVGEFDYPEPETWTDAELGVVSED